MRKLSSTLVAGLAGSILFVIGAAGFEPGLTETEGAIRNWHKAAGKEEGLLADSVTSIIQTRDGFLWVGTSEGLARFDGVKFTKVPLSREFGTQPIWVTALCEDLLGHVWIGTQQDGLFKLERGALHRYTRSNGLLDENITSLAADGQGLVWIGTRSGLNLFTGSEFKSFTVLDGLPDALVSGVHVARSGTVWITTRSGMCRLVEGRIATHELETGSQGRSPEYLGAYEDRRGNIWAFGDTYLVKVGGKRFNYFRGNEAPSARIWSLCEGHDGRLWIGSGRGLYCFDDDRFQQVVLDELLAPYDVRAICEDREGNLWLGTASSGLVQLRPQPVQVLKAGQGLPSNLATALALDTSGRIIVALARGGLFVGESGPFERFGGGEAIKAQHFITSLVVARNETVWAGTFGGGLYGFRDGRSIQLTTANGLADDAVLSVCEDREGQVWVSTSAGTVHRFADGKTTRYDAANGLTGAAVTTLVKASAGGIWVGAEDGSILRCDGEAFARVQAAEQVERPILALHEGDQVRLWVGTTGGLACLRRNQRSKWNTAHGLPNDTVASVMEDAGRNLWIGTGAGIYRISSNVVQRALEDPESPLTCKLISDARTSFETIAFGGTRAMASPDGKLWFATSEGVVTVDLRRPQIDSATLPVHLESVAFNSQPPISGLRGCQWSSAASNDAPAVVRGEIRSLEFHFTALKFSAPEKLRFRHKLEGFDADWVDDGTERVHRYLKLPNGKYRFRVAARFADGDWHEAGTGFAFTVPTPLYFQGWAIGLYTVTALGLVAGVVRVVSHRRLRRALARMEQQQTLERERMRIARDMHDEIGSKLTKLSFLSEHARMDTNSGGPLAGKLEAIAGTSRDLLQTMDEIVWVVNPRNDTLENLAAYLSHYASEYFQNTRVECDMRLPRAIPDHPLSSEARHNLFLAFEEALNNVLKHSDASKVKIEMSISPEFEIKITDDGRGFDLPENGTGQADSHNGRGGNGLKNMRQRLEDIGGECRIRSQPGAGTTVTLRIELNHTHPA